MPKDINTGTRPPNRVSDLSGANVFFFFKKMEKTALVLGIVAILVTALFGCATLLMQYPG